MLSIVIPVYKNEESLPRLLGELERLAARSPAPIEVVFVVDGSPDRSLEILRTRLPPAGLEAQLISLSRNFGSFSAIRAGLQAGRGSYFAILTADLQEPPELALQFLGVMQSGGADVALGVRTTRADPLASELPARLFWWLYRTFVVPDLPAGGVDVFGCTRSVRDRLLELSETTSNLVAQLLWLGFKRRYVAYERHPRLEGKSAWTLGRKLRYSLDSIFAFTDIPLRFLLYVGALGTVVAVVFALVLLVAKLTGNIPVTGYTAIALSVAFFGSITSLGLGILGQYVWLTLQNARQRPGYIVHTAQIFSPGQTVRASDAGSTAGTPADRSGRDHLDES